MKQVDFGIYLDMRQAYLGIKVLYVEGWPKNKSGMRDRLTW